MEILTVSVAEACRLIGIGRTKVYELIKERRLETVKLGRRTLVKVRSIRTLLADRS